MRRFLSAWTLMAAVACQGGGGDGTDVTEPTGGSDSAPTTLPTAETGTPSAPCAYPEGAVDPMALGEVMPAFSWPDARHLDGRTASLELEKAACNDDDDIDWSPFDVLVFVSIPAW